MYSQLATTDPTSTRRKPNLQTPDQHRYLSTFTSAIETTESGASAVSNLSAPTPRLRSDLQVRLGELRAGMSADVASRENAAALVRMIIDLFDAYPTVRMDPDKAQGVARTFAAHVEHMPHWAIREGIFDVQARKTAFPPSPGELKAACEEKLRPLQDEAAQIAKVLDAKVFHQNSEEERARVKSGFADLLADLRQTNGFARPRRAADYRDRPDVQAQGNLGVMPYRDKPTSLSDEALGKMGRRRPIEEDAA